ncbi:MAG: ATP-dependent RNA helicase HrpA [Proteobacteria bacterium]|nr:ATP-dependent RNA helicase HrpA [Burkholderiales bacterium]
MDATARCHCVAVTIVNDCPGGEFQCQCASVDCASVECVRFDRAVTRRDRADRSGRHTTIEPRSIEVIGTRRVISRFSPAEQARRLAALPAVSYPDELPVAALRGEIAASIAANRVVIVCGETGSGKTTQLPKICLELKRGVHGLIGHTQPRRIAARSVASRIAQELNSPLGALVGFKVRFADRLSPANYVKVMTDGILLAEIEHDAQLSAYDTLIIDEAHERSLNIDFLLGYLKQLVRTRADLKVIVTSATIDAARFSAFFDGAPVIEVSGRLYPVELRYRPLVLDEDADDAPDPAQPIIDAVAELARERGTGDAGDILVFLPGEREIRDTAEALRKQHPKGFEILPLYARLSFEEQERVFKPGGIRRIVLATNVAETSLTVPGVRYVIDTGTERVKRYSFRNKVELLQIEPISRAAANQRAGRCGRLGAGVCIRLYAEDAFEARPAFSDPEILRTSIAAVILRMKALGLPEIGEFPFIDPPTPRAVADGYQLLTELGALDEARALTAIGRELARFPTDPRLGRILVAARVHGCLAEALVVCAVLAVQDPRERPFDQSEAADRAHAQFVDPQSDFATLLALWKFHEHALHHRKSQRKHDQAMQAHFLSPRRLREWRDVHAQMVATVAELGWRVNEVDAGAQALHRALLAGFIGNIGFKLDDGDGYGGARGIRFQMHPSSGLRKAKPKWVMAAELTETTRLYGRTLARVDPEAIEQAGDALLKREYLDPHWERERAMVIAFERVTLFGLTLVARRKVHYGPIDPVASRMIFIREALVAGAYAPSTSAAFVEHNRRLTAEVEALEHKARRKDVLVDPEAIAAFYAERIPADISNGAGFERWRREVEADDPRILFLSRDYLMRHAASSVTETLYPERWPVDALALGLSYRFEPGHPLDGVTVTVPLPVLNRIDAGQFDWLVPGMIREKVTLCLKALPKSIRRQLVPVPEQVTKFLAWADPDAQSQDQTRPAFDAALTTFVKRETAEALSADALRAIDLPAHLRFNYRVVDDAGSELATGRDLAALRAQLGEAALLAVSEAGGAFERAGITAWDFGELPASIAITQRGRRLTAHPGIEDAGPSVALRLFDTEASAGTATRLGIVRLLRLEMKDRLRLLDKRVREQKEALLALRGIASADAWVEDVVAAIADRAFIGDDPLPRAQMQYEQQRTRARTRLPAVADAGLRLFTQIALAYAKVAPSVSAPAPMLARPAADIRVQLDGLVYLGFMRATPWDQLAHLVRYLKAIELRITKYPDNPERDRRHAESISGLARRVERRREELRAVGEHDLRVDALRWQIEELRVSLFAQELRTPAPVSLKRLQKAWESALA